MAIHPEEVALFRVGELPLQPFAAGDSDFVVRDIHQIEIAHPGAVLREDDPLRLADDPHRGRIHFRHEQWRAAAEHAVVQFALPVVHEVERVAVLQPFLLRVVVAEILAVVETPERRLAELQADAISARALPGCIGGL